MKKYILSFMMLVVSTLFLTSCLSDNGNSNSNQPTKVTVTSGLYVVNCGIWGGNNGSLTLYDYNTLKAQQLFSGIGELGDMPNDAYTKGDTIFIVVNTDNMIVVFNRKTMKVDRISTTKEMGEAKGYGPRCITGFGDNIYFTTYGNYVARMDAKTLTVTDMKQVGNAPEGLALGGTYSAPLLYVCNSNYGMGGGSISKKPRRLPMRRFAIPKKLLPKVMVFIFLIGDITTKTIQSSLRQVFFTIITAMLRRS